MFHQVIYLYYWFIWEDKINVPRETNIIFIVKNERQKILTCQDYTVTNEKFDLILDKNFDMLITSPKPKPEELNKYYESENYISHTDSNKSLIDKVYQAVKNYTIKQKVNLINSFKTEEKSILDIGCGTGDFLLACKNNGWTVFGVEPNSKAKSITLKKIKSNNIEDSIENLFNVQNNIQQYDVITMWHVLEHVPNLTEYISNLKKLLKPNGTLIIAVPNYKSYDAQYYEKFWAAYDVPRHLWHFSQKSIQLLFSKYDFQVEKTLPMKFDSYYVSLLSEKYKTGTSNLLRAFYRGFVSNLKAKKTKDYSSLIYIIKSK